MTRVVLIVARRSFDRTAVRAMLRGRLAQTDVRECETAQKLVEEIARFRCAIVIVERALLQPKLEAALAAFGARAIRIGDGAGIDLGKLANELPPQFERALSTIAPAAQAPSPTREPKAERVTPSVAAIRTGRILDRRPGSPGGATWRSSGRWAPWIVAQHMPDHGSASLAEHLAAVSGFPVRACGVGPVADRNQPP